MKLNTWLVMALGGHCLAAQYAIANSCDNTDVLKSRDGIVRAMQEAVDIAENAFDVMTNHKSDDKVQSMFIWIFGTNDFDNRFSEVKAVFEALKAFSKEPSSFRPQDQEWKTLRSNTNVEMHCDTSRFIQIQNTKLYRDISTKRVFFSFWVDGLVGKCYNPTLLPTTGSTKASTWNSNDYDINAWQAAGGSAVVSKELFSTVTTYPNVIDLCTWNLKMQNADQWPKIDANRIDKAKSQELIRALTGDQTLVDTILQTFGATLLHELTHTNQGGILEDDRSNDLPDGTRKCYGWRCVHVLQNVRNSDSVNMLGVALQVWTLNHWVNNNGEIVPL